ncbi:endosulfine alpha [Columba livia]|uniref:Endosulfine alpha n=1 Tax=Columba livia TaxID=8932 RepID=A0A2I0LM66_COLLI|nr:endosulfine alpha [Columba livia]
MAAWGGHAGEGARPPRAGGGGEAQSQIPQPGPETRRLRFPHEEAAERAKILRFRRLQHGQGQDEEQAAPERDRRPHPHPAGPAAAQILPRHQQAGRVARAARLCSYCASLSG